MFWFNFISHKNRQTTSLNIIDISVITYSRFSVLQTFFFANVYNLQTRNTFLLLHTYMNLVTLKNLTEVCNSIYSGNFIKLYHQTATRDHQRNFQSLPQKPSKGFGPYRR